MNTQNQDVNQNQPVNLRTVHMYLCVCIIAHGSYAVQHETVWIIFHPNLQAIIKAQMLSIRHMIISPPLY